ncbi:MAG: glutamate-1-semialdehyde 2,1-aminomutase [Legionellales bacterium]|nr:glutamate-1-semialdehyde 2,1-aminomutase [Legionellales bacterium]
MFEKSIELYRKACEVIPAGVNSPVRAFGGVGGNPIFINHGEGAFLVDVDNNRYLDYVASWGPLILGHAHPEVVDAMITTIHSGTSFGAPTELEIRLAEKIVELIPSVEKIRMINSGTEAAMTAIRLARGYTGRNKIIKFIGCYHGHADALLVKAGSGALTFGVPNSAGVPNGVTEDTLLANFNDLTTVTKLFEHYGNDIAAVLVEPVAGNMNCVLPVPGFLEGLRELCDHYSSVLVFDEVMTGFRVGLGGAQHRFNVRPDLSLFAKVIGGGMPVGAVGGRREIMDSLAPLGAVYQAGTLSGNPLAMTAGLKTLEIISRNGFFTELENKTIQLTDGLMQRAQYFDIPFQCTQIGSMFGLFFTDNSVINTFDHVQACNINHYRYFFHSMIKKGFYFAPSAFEVGFMSCIHSEQNILDTLDAAETTFAEMAKL